MTVLLSDKQARYLSALIAHVGKSSYLRAKAKLGIPAETTLLSLNRRQASVLIAALKDNLPEAKRGFDIRLSSTIDQLLDLEDLVIQNSPSDQGKLRQLRGERKALEQLIPLADRRPKYDYA